MKRAMEVMVWFYENCNHFLTLIQDEDDDGDGDDKDDSDEEEDEQELEERPRYNEERATFEYLSSLGDERPGLSYQAKNPSFTEGRAPLKVEPSPLREGHHLSFEDAVFSPREERPAVKIKRSALIEGQPILKKAQGPLKEEERSAQLENWPSAHEEVRSTLKGKRPILKKAQSPPRVVRPTFKEEHLTREKEEATFLPRVLLAEPRKTMLPEEPDLLLPEEICSTASQV